MTDALTTNSGSNGARKLELPRDLVDFLLLGPLDDRRQLQDSPILGDVWTAYAAAPADYQDVLITPFKGETAGRIAKYLHGRAREGAVLASSAQRLPERKIAYLQGLVAARLYFDELLGFVVPATSWWHDRDVQRDVKRIRAEGRLTRVVGEMKESALLDNRSKPGRSTFTPLDRYLTVAALILWAARTPAPQRGEVPLRLAIDEVLRDAKAEDIVAPLLELFDAMFDGPLATRGLVFQISLNRRASLALERSVPAVKADAARSLFKVKCDRIGWAVVDSGIDTTHVAFRGDRQESRVEAVYDFTRIREIISVDNLDEARAAERAERIVSGRGVSRGAAKMHLMRLAKDAEAERPVDWELVEKFVRLDKPGPPHAPHGTHVAGILGGKAPEGGPESYAGGMCPDIKLYDFRVLAKSIDDTEFAIIAALQFIRYLNERHGHVLIHGANLSLSIPHNVRNFACGRTPICVECERMVESGVVVVAAAGNRGYHNFETADGSYEGYAAFSITDPGNADGVITVGSTHRHWPHTYGVSFFSSRGPTGDGRLKPDIVAPGERIFAPLPDGEWGPLDGTSMASPHVSGAAAMLMARYSELIGQPRRIKRILCENATDLGRERSFQGSGMLDILRAFQSI